MATLGGSLLGPALCPHLLTRRNAPSAGEADEAIDWISDRTQEQVVAVVFERDPFGVPAAPDRRRYGHLPTL